MPSLAQMANNSATLSFSWQGLDFTIEYAPGALTDGLLAQFDAGYADLNAALATILKSWDVQENDGVTPFPLDAARLAELPFPFKQKLVQEMIRDARPN